MTTENDQTIKGLLNKASVARRENRLEDAKRAASSAIELSRHDSKKEHYAAAIKSLGQIERDLGNVNLQFLYMNKLPAFTESTKMNFR